MKKHDSAKKIRNRIVSATATLFFVVTLCCCLYVIIQVLTKGYVSVSGHCFFRVVTGSMEPSLSVGELILTDGVDIETVCVGDVISFRSQSIDTSGKIITHRVVEVAHDTNGDVQLLTKGDANLSVDGIYVTAANYIGKVIWTSGDSFFSSVMSFLTDRYGFLACVVFPCLLILGIVLKDNVKAMRQDIKKLVESVEGLKPTDSPVVTKKSLSSEEYESMKERLRAELLEELKNCDYDEKSEKE